MSRLFNRTAVLLVTPPAVVSYGPNKTVHRIGNVNVAGAVRALAPLPGIGALVADATEQTVRAETSVETTTLIRDLRVTFEIEKHLGSEPNTCKAVVYNLAESSRALFQRKPLSIRLDAGYDGELQRLFTGDVRWCDSHVDGADWCTTIQVADGDRAHRFARVARSYEAGVTTEQAVKDTVKAMGLTLDRATSAKLGAQYVSGLTLHGNAAKNLTKLLKPRGLTWSVQDGRLQVLAAGDVRTDDPIEISQDTGMIGSPEYGPPIDAGTTPTGRERKGHAAVITFKVLLYPNLTPGGRVHLRTRSINGVFKVNRVTHSGDTHGTDWYSEVEAQQVKG